MRVEVPSVPADEVVGMVPASAKAPRKKDRGRGIGAEVGAGVLRDGERGREVGRSSFVADSVVDAESAVLWRERAAHEEK